MKRLTKFLVRASVAIILILVFTNPSNKNFEENLTVITKLPQFIFKDKEALKYVSYGRDSNFFIFSIFVVDINFPGEYSKSSEHFKILGIFGNFYVMKP